MVDATQAALQNQDVDSGSKKESNSTARKEDG
jgi:hypothetical protein